MKLSLEQYLPYRLAVTSAKVSGLIAKAYEARFGLNIAQWRLLAVLNEAAPLSGQDLVSRTLMDKVMVSRTVSSLIERGLIKRKANNKDKRFQSLTLSKMGQQVVNDIIPLAKDLENALIGTFSHEEILSLESLLDAMSQRVDELESKE
jgi:DNA-binding MarR family transcriptional regulator